MVLFRVAAAVHFLADLLVPTAPVVVLAGGVAVSRLAPHTPRGVVGQWRGAGGAIGKDHVVSCVFNPRGRTYLLVYLLVWFPPQLEQNGFC